MLTWLLLAFILPAIIAMLVRFAKSGSYVYILARGIDVLCATWLWRDFDITISSFCGLELRKPQSQQRLYLRWLGLTLNWVQKGHCEAAIAGDRYRALAALDLLPELKVE